MMTQKYMIPNRYKNIMNDWKNNLIKKAKRKERKKERDDLRGPPIPSNTKLILHTPLMTKIDLNQELYKESFAVIDINKH